MRWRPLAFSLLLGVLGALGVALLLPAGDVDVGPAVLSVSARPAPTLSAGTTADLGSLGRAVLDTHEGPVALRMRMQEIDPDVMTAVLAEDSPVAAPDFDVSALRSGAIRYLAVLAVAAGAGGAVTAGVVQRRRSALLFGAVGGLGAVVLLGAVTAATFRPEVPSQVRFEGALSVAPAVYGDVTVRYDDFVAQVGALTSEFAVLQQRIAAGATGPVDARDPAENGSAVSVLVITDLHLNSAGMAMARQLAGAYDVDVVVNLGDETDWGTEAESELVLGQEQFGVPYLWIRGNHDSVETQAQAASRGATVLDDDVVTVRGLTFYGIGDPTFTPQKSQEVIDRGEQQFKRDWSEREFLPRFRQATAEAAADSDDIDVLLVHDEAMAHALPDGEAPPLVLSGHRHRFKDAEFRESRSVWVGSTGGAGLRAFDNPAGSNANQAAVFYFDPETGRAIAYDVFTFRPLDENRFTMRRVLLPEGVGSESTEPSRTPSPPPSTPAVR